MKNTLLLLLAVSLLLVSCKEDEDPITDDIFFNYDGDNQSAPFLPVGQHDMAVRFPANLTSDQTGKSLTEIRFYILNLPTSCEVRVYGTGTETEPGDLIYSADVSSGIGPNGWNIHPIPDAIEITGEDLWLVLRVTHTSETNSIGCDSGPANSNGDWILSTGVNNDDWQSFRQRTNNEVNINWNIRARVE